MKKSILLLLAFLFIFQGCSSKPYLSESALKEVIANKEFTFMAERAIPSFDGVNIANTIPRGGAAQLLNLDYGYRITITNDEINSDLPYFGRSFSSTRNPDRVGIKFISKDFEINIKEEKKGAKIITLQPNDVTYINTIIIEVSPSGRAYTSVSANDRQPISYSGFVKLNEEQSTE